MTSPARIAIVGASGRMGTAIRAIISEASDLELGALVGRTEGDGITADLDAITDADVVIDISAPDSCVEAAGLCAAHRVPFVSGTTGLDDEAHAAILAAAQDIPVILAANFSVGVNALEHLVELAARATPGWDIEVFESHHRNKVDSPSGTALFLGRAAARGSGDVPLEERAVWGRHGQAGPRSDDEIGFQVVRGGSVVGEHTVFLLADGERIELTHRALDRGIFAKGAVRAARWLREASTPGLYSMKNVLFG